eukprot:7655497-Pyramimonas_sp.AAC.1
MAFPYMRDGELVNIKYRGPNKTFWQVKGAEKLLYGLDDIKGADTVIIVEGELDKLALEEAGDATKTIGSSYTPCAHLCEIV